MHVFDPDLEATRRCRLVGCLFIHSRSSCSVTSVWFTSAQPQPLLCYVMCIRAQLFAPDATASRVIALYRFCSMLVPEPVVAHNAHWLSTAAAARGRGGRGSPRSARERVVSMAKPARLRLAVVVGEISLPATCTEFWLLPLPICTCITSAVSAAAT